MDFSLDMLETVFDPEVMPILEISPESITPDSEPCLIVYTDASYFEDRDTVSGELLARHCHLSVNVYDQRDATWHKSHVEMPESYYEHFPELKSYIGRGEIGAAIGMLYSNPALFAGRRIIHFIDNAPALSNLVNGYSGKADVARLVNMFHLALLALGCEWYGEWVPSKANIADIMTRVERHEELRAGLGETAWASQQTFVFQLPPLGMPWASLKAWVMEMRASRERAGI